MKIIAVSEHGTGILVRGAGPEESARIANALAPALGGKGHLKASEIDSRIRACLDPSTEATLRYDSADFERVYHYDHVKTE